MWFCEEQKSLKSDWNLNSHILEIGRSRMGTKISRAKQWLKKRGNEGKCEASQRGIKGHGLGDLWLI